MAEIIKFDSSKKEPKKLKSLSMLIPFKKSAPKVISLEEGAKEVEESKKIKEAKAKEENLEKGMLEIGKLYVFKNPIEMQGQPARNTKESYETVLLKKGKVIEEIQFLKEPLRYKIIGIPEGKGEEFICFVKRDDLKGNIERELVDI